MRHDDLEIPIDEDGTLARVPFRQDASLGDLFKRLTTDTGELIRQEAGLAKAEIRETGTALVNDARAIGVAAGLGVAGALSLVAFLVIGLGVLLDGRYWLSSLVVGVVALAVGALMVKGAMRDIKQRSLVPQQTLETLRADKAWARQQARELAHDLTTDPTTATAGS